VAENSLFSSMSGWVAGGAASYGLTYLKPTTSWAYYASSRLGFLGRLGIGAWTVVPTSAAVGLDLTRLEIQLETVKQETRARFNDVTGLRNEGFKATAKAVKDLYVKQQGSDMVAEAEIALSNLKINLSAQGNKLAAYSTFQSTLGSLFETLKGFSQSHGSFENVDPSTLRMLQTRLREAGERYNGTSSGGFMGMPAVPPPPPRLRPQQ